MKQVADTGIYVPDSDHHFFDALGPDGRPGVLTYQYDRLKLGMKKCWHRRVALDVGAHVGLLARHLAGWFDEVHAFEANPDSFECLEKNVEHLPNVICYHLAIGDVDGRIGIDKQPTENTGNRQIDPAGRDIDLRRLDTFLFDNVDFIKIDVQGYEPYVLRGARGLLRYCRPTVMVEIEPPGKTARKYKRPPADALEILRDTGSAEVAVRGVDHIWQFPPVGENITFDKYDRGAMPHWDKYQNSPGFAGTVDQIVAAVKAYGDKSLLDVGCGDGLYTYHLGAFGIDSHPIAIRLARSHGVPCEQFSVREVARLGRKYDAVCLFDVLEHLYDQREAVQLLGDITNRLHILNPAPIPSEDISRYHTREFTAEQLIHWMQRQGWRCVGRETFVRTSRNIKDLLTFEKG